MLMGPLGIGDVDVGATAENGRKPGLDAPLGQGLNKAPAVHVVEEDRLAPVALIHGVVDRAGILNPQLAGHEATMTCARITCQYQEPTPSVPSVY